MATKQVVGLFSSMSDAQAALQDLRNAGFNDSDISLVARNNEGTTTNTSGDGNTRAGEDAAFGATSGGLMGGLGGLLVGLGALAIPGIGPVIAGGSLAAALGSAAVGAGVGAASGGLIGALVGAGIPDEDANVYAEGVRRGGALVTVQASDSTMASQAADIMDRHNVQDIDNLGQNYRSAGWTRFDETAGDYDADKEGSGLGTGVGTLSGAATGAAIGSAGGPIGTVIGGVAGALTGAGVGAAADKVGANVADDGVSPRDTTDTSYTGDTTRMGSVSDANYTTDTTRTVGRNVDTTSGRNYETTNREGEMTIPVVEEQINVGKREVQGGGVRVETHVTEKPVNEQVTLHEEHVNVERRPVNQPVDPSQVDQLREGTFEVRERSEEAVVQKQARVVEEVVINKEQRDRTENIQDSVRRTDVDVQEIPGETRSTGYTQTSSTSTTGTSDRNRTVGSAENEGVIERGASKAENALERGTGADLNRDGDVGVRDPRNNVDGV